jgi:hypothetical protein
VNALVDERTLCWVSVELVTKVEVNVKLKIITAGFDKKEKRLPILL